MAAAAAQFAAKVRTRFHKVGEHRFCSSIRALEIIIIRSSHKSTKERERERLQNGQPQTTTFIIRKRKQNWSKKESNLMCNENYIHSFLLGRCLSDTICNSIADMTQRQHFNSHKMRIKLL